ncbi:efflux RND transporter periplasmic adaptor subunit [Nitrosophilus alvini]|uniref:efflux RND transporter periplasmic adaptor subunit n=1 Tax=Nitrosophilus alvini TaxID=2714855 RepID=UPI00190D80C4|nr:efflux RND transporter periplasmic adaptor subunit [Nitrosophilus alvini]
MKKLFGILILILLIAGGVIIVKKKKEQIDSLPVPAAKSISIETVNPKKMKIEQKREFIGRYYSLNHPQIASKISGFIQKVYVEEGDQIKKGDILISIDDRELKAAVEAQKSSIKALERSIESIEVSLDSLKSDYQYAKKVYERNLVLFEADAVSKEKLDQSEVAMKLKLSKYESTKKSVEAKYEELNSLKEQLKAKINQLRYAIIRSPIDGTVGKIFLRVGDLATAGKPLIKLFGDKKRVEFLFPAALAKTIRNGKKVYVDGVEAKISEILPDSEKALFVARIDLQTSLGVPENSNVKVEVVEREAFGMAVPVNALLEKEEGTYVFEHVDGSFLPKKVTIMAQNEKYAIPICYIAHPVAVGSSDKLSKLFVLKNGRALNDE